MGAKVGVILDFDVGEIETGIKADQSWHSGKDEWPDIDKTQLGGYIGYNFKF